MNDRIARKPSPRFRQWGLIVAVAASFVLLLFFAFIAWESRQEPWSKRKVRFQKAAERGMIVAIAIGAYEAQEGALPPTLDALVPKYLLKVPETGLRDYPRYEYQVFANTNTSLVWYDLGTRKGQPARALWIYDEGDINHAILALTLDQHELITEARVDRMPAQYEQIEFDVEKWKRNDSRIEMVRSLPKQFGEIKYRPFSQIKKILGEPSGRTVLRNSPWELAIRCPQKGLNWDVFFYWPTEDYPPRAYGGTVERIGRWAYVHE